MKPYSVEPFGGLVIPKDWLWYTPLAGRLQRANNEEAMGDLLMLISRVRRSRAACYEEALGKPVMVNLAGVQIELWGWEK